MQTNHQKYKSSWHCFVTTWRQEGVVGGLYAGTAPALVAAISEMSVMMATYGQGQRLIASLAQKDAHKVIG